MQCINNPNKYRRYEIDWNEKEPSNAAAAAATFDFLRKLKAGQKEEERADLTQAVVFNKKKGGTSRSAKPKVETDGPKGSRPENGASLVCFGEEEEDEHSTTVAFSGGTKKKMGNRKFRKRKHDDES